MSNAAMATQPEAAPVLLTVDKLHAWYADSHVLHGMSFDVREGEVLTLIGRRTYEIARQGIAYCPEERAIFSSLSVRENLLLPPVLRDGGLSLEQLFQAFPNLKERSASQGTKLSGGEQQMLAIGRILRTGARFLLLDEPSEGLAPVVVREIGELIRRLKRDGFTILLVEQNLRFARKLADRHVVVENGRVVDILSAATLDADMGRVQSYLGV